MSRQPSEPVIETVSAPPVQDEAAAPPVIVGPESPPPRSATDALAASASQLESLPEESDAPVSHSPREDWLIPCLSSMVVHAWLLLALALFVLGEDAPSDELPIVASFRQPAPEVQSLDVRPLPIRVDLSLQDAHTRTPGTLDERPQIALAGSAAQSRTEAPLAALAVTGSELLVPVGTHGGGLGGRSPDARARLVKERGGNEASELAVTRGLRWLVAHQMDDGSWRLNHQLCPRCGGLCGNPGNVGSTTAATGLALLPFLGAGSTHLEGDYREEVKQGLYYLASRMVVGNRGGDLQEGTMYAQALATIALCEAYAMSGDEALRDFAQAAIDFIVHAQHAKGGWRYLPGQPGDTTSLGWQLMALKSGQMAGLKVPPATFYRAAQFLDSVQTDGGAYYGYQKPDRNPTMTSIGLLSRMYLGWRHEREALGQGVDFLAELGPSPSSMYFNYYATQVLHHYQGRHWDPWNRAMRDYLIRSQSREGHESGSWYFEDPHTKSAGRLYNTAMAVMTLEVYYRYLPLYGSEILEGER